jgi:hypothetical protein
LKGQGNFLQDKKFPWTYRLLLFILKKGAGGTFFDSGRQCAASNSAFGIVVVQLRLVERRCGNVPLQIPPLELLSFS